VLQAVEPQRDVHVAGSFVLEDDVAELPPRPIPRVRLAQPFRVQLGSALFDVKTSLRSISPWRRCGRNVFRSSANQAMRHSFSIRSSTPEISEPDRSQGLELTRKSLIAGTLLQFNIVCL
jgi:hypothetical protein